MINARIYTSRGTTYDIDLLIGDEPDVLGAARIVPGNIKGVKAIIVGQKAQEAVAGRTLGPMASGSSITVAGPSDNAVLASEVVRITGEWVTSRDLVVDLHDRYESPAQYAALSV